MSTLSHHNTHFNETIDILQNGPTIKAIKNKNRLMADVELCKYPSATPPESQKKRDTLLRTCIPF